MTTKPPIRSKFPLVPFLLVLGLALGWRVFILTVHGGAAVSFHSDEAVVGLMARHYLQTGILPTFFYGQAYMGSLDPWLVSLAFRVIGDGVLAIRVVQSILYLGTVATTMLLAWKATDPSTLGQSKRANKRGFIMLVAGLLMALPTPLVSLYTTISLGGYGETLLIGNLLLLIVPFSRRETPSAGSETGTGTLVRWVVIGALLGLGWWTNSLIIAYAVPVGVLFLIQRESWRAKIAQLGLGAIFFLVASSPWWIYNLNNAWASLRFLSGGVGSTSLLDKAVGFLFIGIPAVIGVRYPWEPQYWIDAPLAVGVSILWAVFLIITLRRNARRMLPLAVMLVVFSLIFLISSFGLDSTGRYLLPLVIPITILFAEMCATPRLFWVIILFLGVNVAGTINAVTLHPTGLTPQFDPITDIPNTDDQRVIDFLAAHQLKHGYSTYWVAFRLMFLSNEAVILSPALPYKDDLRYTNTDRYPPYSIAVRQADRPFLLTAHHPALDAAIEAKLKELAITWKSAIIGDYHVYYELSLTVTPELLGFGNPANGTR